MKLSLPKLPAAKTDLQPLEVSQLQAEVSLDEISIYMADASGLRAKNLTLDTAILEKVLFTEARLEKLGLLDVELKGCDLTAARCSESSLIRVRITGRPYDRLRP